MGPPSAPAAELCALSPSGGVSGDPMPLALLLDAQPPCAPGGVPQCRPATVPARRARSVPAALMVSSAWYTCLWKSVFPPGAVLPLGCCLPSRPYFHSSSGGPFRCSAGVMSACGLGEGEAGFFRRPCWGLASPLSLCVAGEGEGCSPRECPHILRTATGLVLASRVLRPAAGAALPPV